MNLNPIELVNSPSELKALILEVQRYASWYGQAAVKMKATGAKAETPPPASTAASKLIKAWGQQKPLNQKSLGELADQLKELESKAKTITITMAGPAPLAMKEKITSWCRQNIDPNILIEFRFKSALLGGIVVRFGSHVYDWSFKRQIMASKSKFGEILRNA
jgi:hypothetical protein